MCSQFKPTNFVVGDGMVKRYVDMQFNMWDKDGSGEIDFEEFVKL